MTKKECELYQVITDNMWCIHGNNYLNLIYEKAVELEHDSKKRFQLINRVLMYFFQDLKSNVDVQEYDTMAKQLKNYSENAFQITILIIKEYYANEFYIHSKKESVLHVIFDMIQQHSYQKYTSLFNMASDVLNYLFNVYYIFCVKKIRLSN